MEKLSKKNRKIVLEGIRQAEAREFAEDPDFEKRLKAIEELQKQVQELGIGMAAKKNLENNYEGCN